MTYIRRVDTLIVCLCVCVDGWMIDLYGCTEREERECACPPAVQQENH